MKKEGKILERIYAFLTLNIFKKKMKRRKVHYRISGQRREVKSRKQIRVMIYGYNISTSLGL